MDLIPCQSLIPAKTKKKKKEQKEKRTNLNILAGKTWILSVQTRPSELMLIRGVNKNSPVPQITQIVLGKS